MVPGILRPLLKMIDATGHQADGGAKDGLFLTQQMMPQIEKVGV